MSNKRSKNRSMAMRLVAIGSLTLLITAIWALAQTFQPFHNDENASTVTVVVPPGVDAEKVGQLLATQNVIDSPFFFEVNATLTGRRGKLRPGRYALHRGMSNGSVLAILSKAPAKPGAKTTRILVPEGRARAEIAASLSRSGLRGNYLTETQRPKMLRRARQLGLPRNKKTLEGFLFPATYDFSAGAPVSELVRRQLKTFSERFGKINLSAAKRKNLSRYDVITIASMVEREAQLDKERPLVAAVIYNRLHHGMPLGIDATIRYSTGNWTRPLKESELKRDTPYNTRSRTGLPPTPIANPGIASLKAAARPARVDYLYYVVKPGPCGEHAFSATEEQFQRDVRRYNNERAARGGKSPTSCRQ